MTEVEWLSSQNPIGMLHDVLGPGHAHPTCFVRWDLGPHSRKLRLLVSAVLPRPISSAWKNWLTTESTEHHTLSCPDAALYFAGAKVGQNHPLHLTPARRIRMAHLIRDTLGNPFQEFPSQTIIYRCTGCGDIHPGYTLHSLCRHCLQFRVAMEPISSIKLPQQQPETLSLAQAAYDSGRDGASLDPATLLVLADSLEDIGTDQDILDALRCPDEHIQGFWILDLLLGLR